MPSPRRLPQPLRSAIAAFLLTSVVAGAALYTGAATRVVAALQENVDPQVVLLFVPLCALVLAMVFEVVRMAATTSLPITGGEQRRAVVHWEPGHREG